MLEEEEIKERLLAVQKAFSEGRFADAEALFESAPELSCDPRFNVVERFIFRRREAEIRNDIVEKMEPVQEGLFSFSDRSERVFTHLEEEGEIPPDTLSPLMEESRSVTEDVSLYENEMRELRDFLQKKIEKWASDPFRNDPERCATPWKEEEIDSHKEEVEICGSIIQDSVITKDTINNFIITAKNFIMEGTRDEEPIEKVAASLLETNERVASYCRKVAENGSLQSARFKAILEDGMGKMFQQLSGELLHQLEEREKRIAELVRKHEEREAKIMELLRRERARKERRKEARMDYLPDEARDQYIHQVRYFTDYNHEVLKKSNRVEFVGEITMAEAEKKDYYFQAFYDDEDNLIRTLELKKGVVTAVDYYKNDRIIRKEVYDKSTGGLKRLQKVSFHTNGFVKTLKDYIPGQGITVSEYNKKGVLVSRRKEKGTLR